MSNIYAVAYDSMGRIAFCSCSRSVLDLSAIPGNTLAVLEVSGQTDPTVNYISGGAVTARPTLPAFDSLALTTGQTATVTGLPNPCSVTVNGTTTAVTDGEAQLTWAGVGHFNFTISQWPYIDYSGVIVCT